MKKLPLIFVLLLFSSWARAQCNLVQNGSFENGNVGFTTTLTFSGNFNNGTYQFVNNSNNILGLISNVSPQSGASFMIVDGSTSNPTTIWSETMTMGVGTFYTFCFWYSDVHDGYPIPPSFDVVINGVTMNATPIIANNSTWAQYCVSGIAATGSVTVSIMQAQFNGNGDDFGIDNISLVITPPSVTASASPASICTGSSSTISVNGCTNCTYTWTPGGSTAQSFSASPLLNTTYTVTASNAVGCSSTASVAVAVAPCVPAKFCLDIQNSGPRDVGRNVVATSDGGYVAIGELDETGDKDIYVVKYNSNMGVDFATKIGDFGTPTVNFTETAASILPTEDGYWGIGTCMSASGNNDFCAFKLNLSGALVWSFRYPPTAPNVDRNEFGTKIIRRLISPPSNYAYYAVGYTNSFSNSATDYDMFIVQLKTNGGATAFRRYGNTGPSEKCYDAIVDNTNSFIFLAGETVSTTNNRDLMVVKVNASDLSIPNVNSSIIIPGTGNEYASSITQLPNNSSEFYVCGRTTSVTTTEDIYLLKGSYSATTFTATAGRTLTSNNQNINEWANSITPCSDGRLLVAGGNRFGHGISFKVSPNLLSFSSAKETTIGANYFSIDELNNGEWILTGTDITNSSDNEILFSKTNSLGEGCCNTNWIFSNGTLLNPIDICKISNCNFTPAGWGKVVQYYNEHYICQEFALPRLQQTLTEISESTENTFSIFPNPSNGLFKISVGEATTSVVIYDLSGKQIRRFENLTSTTFDVDLTELSNGIYIVDAMGNDFREHKKILINK